MRVSAVIAASFTGKLSQTIWRPPAERNGRELKSVAVIVGEHTVGPVHTRRQFRGAPPRGR
jgi:hypothetical protein